jgi:hypothetical protein
MSTAATPNELLRLEGPVECAPGSGAVSVMLRGRESGGGAVAALFAGASGSGELAGLPGKLHEVRLFDVAAMPGRRQVQLQSRELQLELVCRSLQLHRDAARPFFTAVPPVHVPFSRRLGWAVLMSILRIPGAARLLAALRGRR